MQIKKEEIAYGGYFKVKKFEIYNPNKNLTSTRECFERGESVAALVYDQENDLYLFTKQYRIGSQSHLIEIIAGSMDVDGETPLDALKRELKEELGVEIYSDENEKESDNVFYTGSYYVSPGGCSEKVHLFIVNKIKYVGQPGGVDDEDIEIVKLTIDEIVKMLNNNEIEDLKTITMIMRYFVNSFVENIVSVVKTGNKINISKV